jgi:hypothetical protein
MPNKSQVLTGLDAGQDRGFDTRQGRTERKYKGGPPLKLDRGGSGLRIG